MKKSLFLLLVLLLTGCSTTWLVSTTGHDPIYTIEGSDAEITVIDNEFELQHLLRTDFNFRYDFAQYALSQPQSFDWRFNRMNRFMGFNRYGYNRGYYSNGWGYSSMWNRSQMWNDWVWGYPFNNGIGWSYSWNNNRWSSNSWDSPYGWNNYYGWNTGYRRSNVVYHTNRRGRSVNTNSRRVINQRVIATTTPRKVVTPKPRRVIRNTSTPVIRTKPIRRTQTVIPTVRANTPTRTIRVVSNRTQPTRRVNSRKKN